MKEVVFQKTPGGAYKINPTGIISLTCTPVLDQPDEGILPGSRLDCEPCGDKAILRGWRGN